MARIMVPLSNRVRTQIALIAGTSVILFGFQNCADMKASTAPQGAGYRLGKNGEKIMEFQPTQVYAGGGILRVLGENLSEQTEIKIEGATCLEKLFVSSQEIQCRAPALPLGRKPVEIAGAVMPTLLEYVEFTKVNSVAGRNGMSGYLDGVARLARMQQIGGMVSDGNVMYFTEYRGNLIRSMDLNTFEVKTLAGDSSVNYNQYADGIGSAALFNYPAGIAVVGGLLYIADRENCAIRKLNLANNEVTTLVGGPPESGYCDVIDGAAGVATLGRPDVLLADGDHLYMSEKSSSGNGVIRRLNLRDLSITTVAGGADLDLDDLTVRSQWVPPVSSLNQSLTFPTALESTHPTLEYDEYEFNVEQAGAVGIRFHFTQLELGEYDDIEFRDVDNRTLLTLSNETRTDFWTPVLPGNSIKILADMYDGGTYGFQIDKIEYVTNAGVPRVHSYDGLATVTAVGGVSAMLKVGAEIFFTDDDLYLVRKLNLSTGQVTGVIGRFDDGTRKIGSYWDTAFSSPYGLANDSRYLYISDMGDGPRIGRTGERIMRMDLVTREASVLLQSDPAAGNPANIDGPLANAAVMQPRHLLYDSARGLFFDCFDVIRRIK